MFRLRQVGGAYRAQHFPKDIIERRKMVHLVRETSGPEPPKTIFLGGDCMLQTCNDALPQCQLGIEFGTHLRNAQVGGAEQIPGA